MSPHHTQRNCCLVSEREIKTPTMAQLIICLLSTKIKKTEQQNMYKGPEEPLKPQCAPCVRINEPLPHIVARYVYGSISPLYHVIPTTGAMEFSWLFILLVSSISWGKEYGWSSIEIENTVLYARFSFLLFTPPPSPDVTG